MPWQGVPGSAGVGGGGGARREGADRHGLLGTGNDGVHVLAAYHGLMNHCIVW